MSFKAAIGCLFSISNRFLPDQFEHAEYYNISYETILGKWKWTYVNVKVCSKDFVLESSLPVSPLLPAWNASPSQSDPTAFHQGSLTIRKFSLTLLGGERHCDNIAFRLRAQHIDSARCRTLTSRPAAKSTNHKTIASSTGVGECETCSI